MSCAVCRPLLQALQVELHGRYGQVSALQEISSQLLLEADSQEAQEAKEKVHLIGSKLHLVLRQVAAALCSLQQTEVCPCFPMLDSLFHFSFLHVH